MIADNYIDLINELTTGKGLSKKGYLALLEGITTENRPLILKKAQQAQKQYYGNQVYIRGLIEISNYCKNDCYYCGIRKSNKNAFRYRLDEEDILACCNRGYSLGFRTFVLQGGEDPWWDADRVSKAVRKIKDSYPECAVTLSLGEQEKTVYEAYFEAGADRYLLRHETANDDLYQTLHPKGLSLKNRKQCLLDLKTIGFQVGTGMMIGAPGQTSACLADDLAFIQDLQPHMVGIGPFISHHDTRFANCENGTVEQTLDLLAIIRIMLPKVLLPATTALASVNPEGRQKGILAGANVIMPNLSPDRARKNYNLYDNKLNTGMEAAEGLKGLKHQMESIGHQIVVTRGDCIEFNRGEGK